MTTELQEACTAFLLDLHESGAPAYERGLDYATRGCVHIGQLDGQRVTARVSGTEDYDVVLLATEDGSLETDCSCPVGQHAEYCKHVAAVAMAVTHIKPKTKSAKTLRDAKVETPDPLPAIIETLDPPVMRKLLREVSEHDRNLRDRILLIGATRDGAEAMAAQWKTAMKSACSTRSFVDWRRMGELARNIDQQLTVLDDWLDAGHAAMVVSLAEYAADRVEGMIGKVDDSDGSISFLLTRIGEQHRRACAAGKPEPRELARRLFKREREGKWDTFRDAVVHYADVLGENGISTYRRLAETAWAKVKPLKPGQQEHKYDSERAIITHIMENLARLDGNVDALVQVYARDLSAPYCYLNIAEALLEAGRAQEALQWAETGEKAFSATRGDERLTRFIVQRHLADGLHEDALQLALKMLQKHPVPANWLLLKSIAEQHGNWTGLRVKLLADLRDALDAPKPLPRAQHDGMPFPMNRSTFVEILLADGDEDAAWQEAQKGPCLESVWLTLARKRAKNHPDDSIAIYQRLATESLRQTGASHYKHAMQHILPAVRLLKAGQGAVAAKRYLDELRETYKRRPAFLEMIDTLG